MKILRILLYLVLGLLALLCLLGLFAKKDYHVERSIDIAAPVALVREQMTNFSNFKNWSPWQKLDPNMKTELTGEVGKVGSVYSWKGSDQVGAGSMTLAALTDSKADIQLKFTEPWASESPVVYQFSEKEGKTHTVWSMDSHFPFPWNVLGMFTDMDKMLGTDFETGLSNLKKLCEELAATKKYNGYEVKESELPVRYYSAIRSMVKFADMANFFMEKMPLTAELTEKQGAKIDGPATGLFWSYDEKAGKSDMATAMPISQSQKLGNGVTVFTVGGGKALSIDYFGAYETTGKAHMGMDEYMAEKGLEQVPPVLEEYITDPMVEKDTSKWLTRVVYFVKPKVVATPAQ